MAILVECPGCRKRQSIKNQKCPKCGRDLGKAKKSQRAKYWIVTRLPNGRQKWEAIGTSIEEAKAAEGKRKAQKFENPRVLEKLSEKSLTFQELTKWYLDRPRVKELKSYKRVVLAIERFNDVFGDLMADRIRPEDLEDYQEQRKTEGISPATIDMEISVTGTMIRRAFDNKKADGEALRAFRCVNRLLKPRSNARERLLSHDEYQELCKHSPAHIRAMLIVAYNSGMRLGELTGLRWRQIDREQKFIHLTSDDTKEAKPKSIPMNHHVIKILDTLPRALKHDFVFTHRGEPVADIRTGLSAACEASGINYGVKVAGGFRFHDIRTTVKTNMLRAGVDKALRDTILGHTLQGMDAYYLKPTDEDLRSAMDKYTTWLDAQEEIVSQTLAREKI